MPVPPRTLDCPTCGYRPVSSHEVAQHREELATVWLFTDPATPGRLVERWHCARCQPHQVAMVMCRLCGTTVMLGGDLAAAMTGAVLPELGRRWLTNHGWHQHPGDWECGQHPARQRQLLSS